MNYIRTSGNIIRNMIKQLGEFDHNKIDGLCSKQDSCEQCRKARMADKSYKEYLAKKMYLTGLVWKKETASDFESRAKDEKERTKINIEFWEDFQENLRKNKEFFER